MAGILAGADPTMRDPPLPGAAYLAAGAVAFCNDLDAVAACGSESDESEGLKSEECFTAVFKYAPSVPACAEALHGASFASSPKSLVNVACKQGLHCIGQRAYNHNSLTPEAKLAVVDLMHSRDSILSVPDAFGEVFAQAYAIAQARVFLLAFSCQDFLWWNRMKDGPFSPESALAGNPPLMSDPSICNRYSSQARDIDEYVHDHPDLVVVVAAGDSEDGSAESVAAPGTCKNCLTVGSTQNWASQLEHDIGYLGAVCRDSDCPQTSRAVARASSMAHSSSCSLPHMHPPNTLPECCHAKYKEWNYSSDKLHWTSPRGHAVSKQASPTLPDTPPDVFADTEAFSAKRIKPDLLAPGLNVISARGGGAQRTAASSSSSTAACSSDLVAASGSSTSAALVASAAALVRQYFREGFSPGGYRGSSDPWMPSAALVRAVRACVYIISYIVF